MKFLIINFLILMSFSNCNSVKHKHHFNYDFENPSIDISLTKSLKEISGLTFLNENSIACINDEKGIIFNIDLTTQKQTKIIEFKTEGDYEGIQKVNNSFFILKSNGDLYEVDSKGEFVVYSLFKMGF